MHLQKSQKGAVIALISILLTSTYAVFNKILLRDLDPLTLTFISQTLSVVILLSFFGGMPEWKKIHKRPAKELIALFIMGVMAAAIAPFVFLKGLELTTATNAILIVKMDSIALAVISAIWLKEKITKQQVTGTLIMLIGLFIVVTKGNIMDLSFQLGDILIFTAAVTWAMSTSIYKKYLHKITPEATVVVSNGIGAITLFFLAPFFLGTDLNFEPLVKPNVFKLLFTFTLLTIVIGQFLRTKALSLLPASKYSMLSLIGPILAVMYAVVFLDELLMRHHIAGGFLVITGLLFSVLHHKRHPHHEKHVKITHHGLH